MAVNPGDLRHLVLLKTPARTPDGAGGFTDGAPTTFATVWARINPLRGTERLAAMQTTADVSHEITLRYLAGVTAQMTIEHESRTFQIVSEPIDPDERHETLMLLCTEVEA